MIKKIVLTIYFLNVVRFSISQPITFEKTYGNDWANKVIELANGGYALTGISGNITSGIGCALLRTDTTGDTIFQKKIIYNISAEGKSIFQTSDSNYIICGTFYNVAQGFQIFLIKTNGNGDTIWSKKYGYSSNDMANDMIKCNDKGYVIIGSTSGTFPSFFKTDSVGMFLWGHITPMEIPYSIKQTYDSGFVLVGFGCTCPNSWVIEKYDSGGVFQWGQGYGVNGNGQDDRFRDVIQLPDSNFMVCGSYPIGLAKINHINGDTIWTRQVSYNAWINSLDYTQDGNIIMAGDNKIFKYDTSGTQLWMKTFPNIDLYSIKATSDGGFVACGAYYGTITQILLIKTDSLGNVSSLIGIDENSISQNNSTVFPNPVTSTSQLNFLNPKNETFHFSISDFTGRVSEEKETRGSSIKIEKGNKPQGVYFYSLVNAVTGEGLNGKFVVE